MEFFQPDNSLRPYIKHYLIIESEEAAVTLAKACPVMDYGGSVEVREVRPRPLPNPVQSPDTLQIKKN